MRRKVKNDAFLRLQDRALSAGAWRASPTLVCWPIAGECADPVEINVSGPYADLGTIVIWARCRRCANCAYARRSVWVRRIAAEIAASSQSWFVTLTYRRDEQARLAHGLRPDASNADRLSALAQRGGRDVTLFLKRLRKKNGARYYLAAEPHKSGGLHWHMVLHSTCTYRQIRAAWRPGFIHARLITNAHADHAARYAAKYVTKNAVSCRIRASVHYGAKPSGIGPQNGPCATRLFESRSVLDSESCLSGTRDLDLLNLSSIETGLL